MKFGKAGLKNRLPRSLAGCLTVWMICSAWPVLAGHPDAGEGSMSQRITGAVLSEVLFDDRERQVFDDYLREEGFEQGKHKSKNKSKELPPGLRKKMARGGELPPGWQKKLERGEVLDGDYYRYSTGLPDHILRQLPAGPPGTSLRRVEDRVVRVMDATNAILDVFYPGMRGY